MRVGVVLPGCARYAEFVSAATEAEAAGIDLLCIEETRPAVPDALLLASGLAARTHAARVLVVIDPPSRLHPIHIAERAAVADLCLQGRLILGVRTAWDPDAEAELMDVLFAAHTPRPFRHEGQRWRIPANLETNVGHDTRITVTPSPAQFELPVWLMDTERFELARAFGLSFVGREGDTNEAIGATWSALERELGRIASKLRRPAFVRLAGTSLDDAHRLVEALRAGQQSWGLDTAIVRYDGEDWPAAMHLLTQDVRPRLRLDTLPQDIESLWDARRESGRVPS